MRVAFFGGTFDPIHRGHLAVARAAVAEFRLDEVIFAPVGRQPLKAKTAEAPFTDRVAMVRLACEGEATEACFTTCEIDAPKPDAQPNYTVDTLAQLAEAEPGAEIFGIAGADSFLTMRSWRQPDRLLALAQWIIVSRPGFDLTQQQISTLGLSAEQSSRVHLLSTVHEDVSASDLRLHFRNGEDCSHWVPSSVLKYIREHGLYGTARP